MESQNEKQVQGSVEQGSVEQSRAPASPAAPGPLTDREGWQYTPHVVVFFSAACIMVIELVAGRLIARHLGSSLYTWTSIIGVVLAGMSIGNYIGGRMADRWRPTQFVGWLFLLASLTCLLTLILNHILAVEGTFEGWHWPARVFTSVLVVFLVPALVLGMISPAMAKLALERSKSVGTTIGSVYAWATVGSIVGTLATGFYLIAALGAQGVVLVVALGLGLVGLIMGPYRVVHLIWLLLLGGVLFLSQSSLAQAQKYGTSWGIREEANYHFSADSNYQYVRVYDDTSGQEEKRTIRVLAMDYLIHGYVDLNDPSFLEYDYERIYRDVAARFVQQKKKLSVFFIGGGSYTFPRLILHQWPGSQVDVAEIDPMVVEANFQALGLPRNTPIRTYTMDARNALHEIPKDVRYDLIFGDAFNDLTVPWHLTTLEFTRDLKRQMTPQGAYLINIIDDYEYGQFLGAMVSTLKRVFKQVYVFSSEPEGVKVGRETFVVAASDQKLSITDWMPKHKTSFPGSAFTPKDLAVLNNRSGGRVLTDDDAPVENLLAPVVQARN